MNIIEMAKSKSQQRFMGMVHAYKKGELDTSSVPADVLVKVKKAAGSISGTEAKKFATTKRKGLPSHVGESHEDMSSDERVRKMIAFGKKQGYKTYKEVMEFCKINDVKGEECKRVCKGVLGEKAEVKEANNILTFKKYLLDIYSKLEEEYHKHGKTQHPKGTEVKVDTKHGEQTGKILRYAPSGKFVVVKSPKKLSRLHPTSNVKVKKELVLDID